MMFCQAVVTARWLDFENSARQLLERMRQIDDVGGFGGDVARAGHGDPRLPPSPARGRR